jgi:hypothetical protein
LKFGLWMLINWPLFTLYAGKRQIYYFFL